MGHVDDQLFEEVFGGMTEDEKWEIVNEKLGKCSDELFAEVLFLASLRQKMRVSEARIRELVADS